jgi:acyl-CoA synthetase (AMP-forming)/AMP-acid ligase II
VLLVPAVILMVVQHCEAHGADLGSVRRLSYGASPIAEDVLMRAMRVFSNARLCQVYGSTEGTAVATFLAPADHDPARGKLRACGKAHEGTELRVADADGNALPPGQVGEIVLRGPGVMKGYWRNPDATRATFFPDGWLRTGDAAYLDDEGFVFIYDRVKDMIVTGAENVYPAEVENAIFGHPAVADVAVIGVPDQRWGEAVKAIVVPGSERRPARTTSSPMRGSGSQASNCQSLSTSSTRCRATRPGRCCGGNCASPTGAARPAASAETAAARRAARSTSGPLARISQCAPTARFTSGGRIHPGSCR